jgi:transcription termination factor Rho
VSPPKAGKTMMLQNIAQSDHRQQPRRGDDRAADRRASGRSDRDAALGAGEVVASTFDEPPARHVQVAEMVIEKGQASGRAQEGRGDPARLHHPSGPRLQHHRAVIRQGADRRCRRQRPAAPKRFFGAARNIEEGGSLTIIATALVDTGSKMDEVIYEEFKGTGNMELHLERKIAEKRVYPAINIRRSGTRREELLTTPDELQKMCGFCVRVLLHDMDDLAAIEFLMDKLRHTKTNDEFFGKAPPARRWCRKGKTST